MKGPAWRLAALAILACLHTSSFEVYAEITNSASAEREASTSTDSPRADALPSETPQESPASDSTPTSTPPTTKTSIVPSPPGMDEFSRLLGYITLLAALAGAVVYIIKFGIPLHRSRSKEERKLNVLEMRPLGNRQFLVVIGYEDTRMLLGVTPGKIDYLCPLDSSTVANSDFSALVDDAEKKGTTL